MLKKEDMSLFIDIHYMNRHEKVENEQKIAENRCCITLYPPDYNIEYCSLVYKGEFHQ